MPSFVPVDGDPFATPAAASGATPAAAPVQFVPVDGDPFAAPSQPAVASAGPQNAGDALDMVEGTGTAAYNTGGPEGGTTIGERVRNLPGMVVAGLDGAANAVPFTDRAAAAAAAATGLGGTFGDYSGNLAKLRGEEGAAMAAHPAVAMAGELAGGAALPVPAVGWIGKGAEATAKAAAVAKAAETGAEVAADTTPLWVKAARGGAVGAGLGAAQGASSSSDLTDVGQTAKDAGVGAGTGAFIGAAVPSIAHGIGSGYRWANPDPVAPLSGVVNPARDVMLGALQKDGPEAVQQRAAAYGDPAMMFDYGTGLKGVAQGLAAKDGEAAAPIVDALGSRQAATNNRVRTGLMQNFGPAEDPAAVKAAIGDVQAASTAPLYARADAAGVPWSPEADALMQRPAVATAMRGAAQDAANAGTPLPTVVLDEAGRPVGSDAAMQSYEAGQRPAVTSALSDMLGADPSRGPLSLEDALKAQRTAQAGPAYAAFRSMQVPMTPELAEVLQRPSVASALPVGERKAADQGRSIYASPANTPAPAGGSTSGGTATGDIPDPVAGLGTPYTVPPTQGGPSVQASAPPRPTGPAPVSLVSALQRGGGIQPSGETAAMGLDRFPGLVRQGGMPLDRAREMAAEAGYLGGDTAHAMANTTPNDLLDALGNHPTYSVHDGDAVAARQAYSDWQAGQGAATGRDYATEAVRSHLLDNGVPAGTIDPQTLDLAAHFVERHGAEPGDAWEQAVMSPTFPGDVPMAKGGAAPSGAPSLETRTFSQAVPAEPGHQVVPINIDKADALWGWTPDYRIGSDAGPGSKLERAKAFISGMGEDVQFKPPQLGVHDQGLGFDDGRNRFAAMRDLGFKTAPASMDPQSIAYARRLGLIDEAPGGGSAVAGPAPRELTPEGLDYVKRSLGDKIDEAQRAGRRDDAGIYTGLKADLLGAIERHPDPSIANAYTAARQAYAAPSREVDALLNGHAATADTVTPEQVAREFGALGTDGERQQYRNGVFTALRDKIAKTRDSGNFVDAVAGNQALRDKFATIAPHPQAVVDFNAALDRARQTFTEAQRPTAPAWRATLERLDGMAAKGDAGAAAARDALATHLGVNPDFARARGIRRDYEGLKGAVDYGRGSLAAGGNPVWPSGFAERFAAMSPAEQAAVRTGQRSLMEEAVGVKPNDQLAIKQLMGVGNTPGYAAPGVKPGAPDLTSFNAEKLVTAHGHQPVARMQELLNANDAMNDTFNGVVGGSKTARTKAMIEALADQEWKPKDVMKEGHGDDTVLGLIRSITAKGLNGVSHAFQSAPSNVARDLDVARIGTLQGPERDAMLGQLLDRLPAFRNREAGVDATRDRALMLASMLAGGGSIAELDPVKRTRMLADQLAGRPRQ